MKTMSLGIALALGGVIVVGVLAERQPPQNGAAANATVAAQEFLKSLSPALLARASYAYDDKIKANWNNLPPTMASRAGVVYSDLSPAQRALGDAVLRSVLSSYGLEKVRGIIGADQYLGDVMRTGPGGFPTGPNAYMLAIFGTPSATQPWSVQFNGHHLGINVAIAGRNRVLAPTLTAAYPNIYTKDGKEIVVLDDEANRALKLMQSLDQQQRSRALLPTQIWDFLLGPGHDGEMIQPEGIKGSEMTAAQRDMLLDVAAAWVNIVDDTTAREKMAEVRRNVADTYFLWSGDTTVPSKAYFRVQGPTILIEYSPQTVGGPGSVGFQGQRGAGGPRAAGAGDGAPARGEAGAQAGDGRGRGRGAQVNDPNRQLDPTHIHTVYRDFTNDYGKKLVAGR